MRSRVLQLVDRTLLVAVLRRDDAQLELGGLLPAARQIGTMLAMLDLVFRYRALQREDAGLLHIVLLEELLVRLQLLVLQCDGAVLGGELRGKGRRFGLRLANLSTQGRGLALDRVAPRAEERALALENLPDARLALAPPDVGGETGLRRKAGLRPQARLLGALGDELDREQIQRGIHFHVFEHDQRLALLHDIAVAHADLAHDAAFLVLHHLAVEIDLDERGSHDRARKRCDDRPAAKGDDARCDDQQARAHQAP